MKPNSEVFAPSHDPHTDENFEVSTFGSCVSASELRGAVAAPEEHYDDDIIEPNSEVFAPIIIAIVIAMVTFAAQCFLLPRAFAMHRDRAPTRPTKQSNAERWCFPYPAPSKHSTFENFSITLPLGRGRFALHRNVKNCTDAHLRHRRPH
eukprot:4607618-Amphidinium_carterae.1